MTKQHQAVETPFNFRYSCWFCGEPAARSFLFPHAEHVVLNCIHPPLSLLSCPECYVPAKNAKASSIWQVRLVVKKHLLSAYQKDLAIGINWTPEELANSEFAGGCFEGFQRSAWQMYEIAKARVNFTGWPLVIAGINIDELKWQTSQPFLFDGMSYPSLEDAVTHYAKTFNLHQDYFSQVLSVLGSTGFSQAVRFCRLLIGSTPDERKLALKQLRSDQV